MGGVGFTLTCAPGYSCASGTAERGVVGRLLPDVELPGAEMLEDVSGGGGTLSGYNWASGTLEVGDDDDGVSEPFCELEGGLYEDGKRGRDVKPAEEPVLVGRVRGGKL